MRSVRVRRSYLVWSLLLVLVLVSATAPLAFAAGETKVTLVHFSDYHSHAVPFYSEGQQNQAGLARAVGYLKQAKATLPNPILLNGGDTMNAGTPAWSDKYTCAEWAMLNGLIDAMALGNHDVDYGWDAFLKCKASAQYPILGASLVVSATNAPVLTAADGKPYIVKQIGDVKIGFFAITGPDYLSLVARKNLTDTIKFVDPIEPAKKIVNTLRNEEKVNAVVLFGHEETDADAALAKAVPGIDLILGTHSHFRSELKKIEGTDTWFISPYQYLTYMSQVELTFADGKLSAVTGKLVKMDDSVKPDAATETKVAQMQKDLEADPAFAARFVKIGSSAVELADTGVLKGESVLGNFVMDTLRSATKANAAVSTASSFRASIPPGDIRMEEYLTALPYKNVVMVYDLKGAQVKELLDLSVSKIGTGNFCAVSGLKYGIQDGKISGVNILKDPANPAAGYEVLDPAKTYKVMTTDYQGKIAAGYKDIFAKAVATQDTTLILNDVIVDFIKKNSPVSAKLDGRVAAGPLAAPAALPAAVPGALPTTGGAEPWGAPLGLGLLLVLAGMSLRRRVIA